MKPLYAILALVILGLGTYFYFNTPEPSQEQAESEEIRGSGDHTGKGDGSSSQGGGGDVGVMSGSGISYYGEVLAEGPQGALLLDFNKQDYENAVVNEELVVLYFYASWCPICRVEFPKMEDAFGELEYSGVVGFRVNYNDNETSDAEKELAREHGVAYQHTKVFIKNSERVLKSPESWEKSRYLSEIENFTN